MTHYATFIRKVQIEMGIQVTEFDPDILAPNIFDEPVDNETDGSHAYQELPFLTTFLLKSLTTRYNNG